MALTQVSRGLLSTSIVDNGNATAITIDSSENVTFSGTVTSDGGLVGDAVSGSLSQAGMLTVSDTNTTNTWANFTGTSSYLPFAHELAVVNLADATTNSFAGLYFMAGETSAASGISSARIGAVRTGASTADLAFSTRGGGDMTQAMRIAGNGDISFYEDTGTNARVVWDSSAETFAIGNIQGSALGTLKVKSDSNHRGLVIEENNGQEVYQLGVVADGSLVFQNSGSEVVRFDDSGNVGIGTSSPSSVLHLSTTNDPKITLTDTGFGASADITGSNGNLRLNSQTATIFDMADSEVMRIDSSGNLLVGRTSRLTSQVKSISSDTVVSAHGTLTSHQTNAGIMQYTSNKMILRSYGATAGTGQMVFNTGGGGGSTDSEAMRINSSGQLLIGTTTGVATGSLATSGLEVVAPSGQDCIATQVTSSGATCFGGSGPTTSSQTYLFGQMINSSGSQVGSIVVSASATAYNTSSDQRLKENIADADDAGSKVDAIQVRKFDWIADGSHQDYGMVAQELQSVAPEAVSGDADSEDMMGVDYSKLVPMLVKEIQSLRARVQQLEN